mmetsp:Transcript_144252/g.268804  ORF Transcript_144252/g.268804 Transcript_144252/m.268804 type:complete len:501 (+) Transcript_144252:73-1575(+)
MFYETDPDAKTLSEFVFQMLDVDNGGFLCQDELKTARSFMMRRFGSEMAEALENDSDANGDGQVDLDEWHQFCEGVYCLLGKKKFMEDLRLWSQSGPGEPRPKTAPGISRAATEPSPGGLDARPKTSPGKARPKAKQKSNASSSEEAAAATKLQSLQRGKKARKDVEAKKAEKKAEHATEVKRYWKDATIAELWEHLSLEGGHLRTTIEVGEVINLYADCRAMGMDINLAHYVPMRNTFDDALEPQELSMEEVAHLCKLVLENGDVTIEGARQSLKDSQPFPPDQDKRIYGRMDGHFNLRRLKAFVALLAGLMRVDEQYIVLAMQYVILGVFELTDTLAALMIERCTVRIDDGHSKMRRKPDFDGEMPNEAVLYKRFTLDEFQRLMYFGSIVDDSGKMGIKYGDISLIFARALKNRTKRLETRAEKKKTKVAKGGSSRHNENGFVGRSEFECLLEELHSITLVQSIFATPMMMAVHFAHKAKEAEEKLQAEASMSHAKTM